MSAFLEAELAARIKRNANYSAGALARDLGISKAYLSLLISGKRRWTPKTAAKVVERLKLSALEQEYSEILIASETPNNSKLKKHFESRLKEFRNSMDVTDLTLEKFEVIAGWEHSAILETLSLDNFPATPLNMAKKLGLPLKRIEAALQRLISVKLIKRKRGNTFQRLDKGYLKTPHDIASSALRRFHGEVLSMAVESLENQPPSRRQISGVTIAIDPEKLDKAKERIKKFTRQLADELGQGTKTEVYQFSCALFRLQEHGEKI